MGGAPHRNMGPVKMKVVIASIAALALVASAESLENVNCAEVPPGEYPYEQNCRKEIQCYSGVGTVALCQNDWLFNRERHYCDFPANVNCDTRLICDAHDQNCYPQSGGNTPAPHILRPDVTCTPAESGLFKPFGVCSSNYCHCAAGEALLETCPNGNIWHNDGHGGGYCDYSYNVPECQY